MRVGRITYGSIVCAGLLAAGGIFAVAQNVAARDNVGSPVSQTSSAHTISVGGHGEISIAPDMATLNVGVESKGQDANEALGKNATAQNAVIAAVKAQGVPDSHIQTSSLSLYFDSEHGNYVASHELTIRIDNVTKVGSILDAAVGAGANNTWGVSFGLKSQGAARAQALQSAIRDARTRGDAIASALGVTISGIGSASEANYNQVPPIPYAAVSKGVASGSAPTPVQPGELTISADVNVAYTF